MGGFRNFYGKITKCNSARIYSKPTIQSTYLGSVSRGTEVMIVEDSGSTASFCKVITSSGLRGYCMRIFLEVINRKNQASEEAS